MFGATGQWYSYSGELQEEYGRNIKGKDGLDDYQGIIGVEVLRHLVPVPETGKVLRPAASISQERVCFFGTAIGREPLLGANSTGDQAAELMVVVATIEINS